MVNDPKKTYLEIKRAFTRSVFLREINDPWSVIVPIWTDAKVRDEYTLHLLGTLVPGEPSEETLVYNDRVTAADLSRGFVQIDLGKNMLMEYADQTNILVKFAAMVQGKMTHFPWIRYRLNKTHHALTLFDRGQFEGWDQGAETTPADFTFITLNDKPCLCFNVEEELPRKVIISKSFNLVPGKKYIVEAGIQMLRTDPMEFIYVILKEEKHETWWVFQSHLDRPHYIELGVTGARSGSTTIEIVASDTTEKGQGNTHSFAITDIAVYEANSLWWEPEWDQEWNVEDEPPVKEPEAEPAQA
ncbi:hypothetical protein [Pseudomonas sp. MYb118]|uniref:hypothetical protein n=1 Tax=Pseudomonas sp. MYb118 TaxID=1848720 RepID=UPI0034D00AA3